MNFSVAVLLNTAPPPPPHPPSLSHCIYTCILSIFIIHWSELFIIPSMYMRIHSIVYTQCCNYTCTCRLLPRDRVNTETSSDLCHFFQTLDLHLSSHYTPRPWPFPWPWTPPQPQSDIPCPLPVLVVSIVRHISLQSWGLQTTLLQSNIIPWALYAARLTCHNATPLLPTDTHTLTHTISLSRTQTRPRLVPVTFVTHTRINLYHMTSCTRLYSCITYVLRTCTRLTEATKPWPILLICCRR